MMKHTALAAAAAATLLCSGPTWALNAPTATGAQAPTANKNAAYTMNIGHVAGPTHPINVALLEFKKQVEQRTGGKVAVNVYDSSSLGGELELLEQMNTGTLESCMLMSSSYWERYDTAANVTLIPFLFDSLQGARAAWAGALGERFAREIIEPRGAYVLSYWESGYRHLTDNDRPIVTPADMKGIKFRTNENDMKIQMFKALDANVIMMPFSELFTALQQGTVGGQENPAANILASSLYEVQKYMSLTGHMYDNCVFGVNKGWFDRLPADCRTVIREEADKARTIDLDLSDETKFIAELKKKGMQVNEVDKEAFRAMVKPVWERFEQEHPGWIELARSAQR